MHQQWTVWETNQENNPIHQNKKLNCLGINLMKEVKDLYKKTINHWWKTWKRALGGGKTSHAHGLTESILWKWWSCQSNLRVLWNPHQNSNDSLHRDRKSNPKVHMKAQKTWNSQGRTEQKEQPWRYHNTLLQTALQNHSNKNSMVLA
jgi:hypothetical protein